MFVGLRPLITPSARSVLSSARILSGAVDHGFVARSFIVAVKCQDSSVEGQAEVRDVIEHAQQRAEIKSMFAKITNRSTLRDACDDEGNDATDFPEGERYA